MIADVPRAGVGLSTEMIVVTETEALMQLTSASHEKSDRHCCRDPILAIWCSSMES